jgi:hypothetical protein
MEGVKAVDSTVLFYNDKYWLFTNIAENPYSQTHDELFLFYSETFPTTNWQPHPMNPLITDVRHARSAGKFFFDDEKLIRPSQDCSKGYGSAVNFNLVKELNESVYQEETLIKLNPGAESKYNGVHTYNSSPGLTFIDGSIKQKRYQI